MTARHNIRIGNRRLGRQRAAIDATPAPRVGELLQIARERKGVDLFRAERDTKIRLKYLAALEDSAYAELPPLVYTKGFLRNYAIYLGLEPEDIITRWRDETQVGRRHERPVVAPPPRPLAAPRRPVLVTPGVLVALMFTLMVIAIFGWIGWQLLRFVGEVPTVSVTYPPALVSVVEEDSIVLSGVSGPRAEITITTPDGQRRSAIADENGRWSREVLLAKGRNDFTVVATDPVTHRTSEPVNLIISVPLPGASPGATVAPTPAPLQLVLLQPANGLVSDDGRVTVAGTTTGTRVTIDMRYLGAIDQPAAPLPSAATPSVTPATPTAEPATPTPAASAGAAASPDPAGSPAPVVPLRDITVGAGGSFSESYQLLPGRWEVSVTTHRTGVGERTETRTVIVRPPVAEGELTLVIESVGGRSWVRIVADGKVWPRYGSRTLRPGQTVTVTAQEDIWLRTGNAGALRITQNGQPVPRLGDAGVVGNWIFRPGQPPERTSEQR
ncbi:MAG: DUF4115 domain-containing protein [Chloroflexota bacterium]|nr:DUF4115 domain-containing protein [Chloroflexota bacterium]